MSTTEVKRSGRIHKDWLPMGLPNDLGLLKEMYDWEDEFGPADGAVKKVIERKLKRITKEHTK